MEHSKEKNNFYITPIQGSSCELQYSMLCNVYSLENTSGGHFLISVSSEKMLKLISSPSKHMFVPKGYLQGKLRTLLTIEIKCSFPSQRKRYYKIPIFGGKAYHNINNISV